MSNTAERPPANVVENSRDIILKSLSSDCTLLLVADSVCPVSSLS